MCWGGKCPCSSQCTKGGATIKTCWNYEDAVQSVINHLVTSPYHGITKEEAEALVNYDLIDCWTVTKKEWQEHQDAMKKRESWKPRPEAKRPRQAIGDGHEHSSGSSGPAVSNSRAGTGMITLSEVQLQAINDSLKRAKVSAKSAAQLCQRAARAFQEEANCIEQCQETVESFLPMGFTMDSRMLPPR